MTTETKLENLLIRDVVPSPTNPRKIFDIHKTEELANSIRQKGVIVPILVRPHGKRFEIVYGERRYRASKIAERKYIPATIRDLSDQEVREMQLVENFQREDVHPMEEAVAIYAAIKTGQYSIEDLAFKVGKSTKYIAGRYKLNDLIPDLQQAFFDARITLKDALLLVTISGTDQTDFYKEVNSGHNKDQVIPAYRIQQAINTYQGNLNTATFSLEDPALNPEMGACTTCNFNSNNANLLFAEKKPYPICMNSRCFKTKTKVHYDAAVKEALSDPAIVTITAGWSADRVVKDIEKKNNITVIPSNHYETIDAPELDIPDSDDYKSEKEYKNALEREHTNFKKEQEDYERKIASGRYKKAFIIEGNDRGKYVYVSLTKTAEETLNKTAQPDELNDIDEEIKRLNDEEQKRKDSDSRKTWDGIAGLLTPENLVTTKRDWKETLSPREMRALALTLIGETGYPLSDLSVSTAGLDDGNIRKEDLSKLDGITPGQINHLLRIFIIDKLTENSYGPDDTSSVVLTDVLKRPGYFPEQIAALQEVEKAAAAARAGKLTKRLAELETRKQQLLQPKKEDPKTTAKKNGIKQLTEGLKVGPIADAQPSLKPQQLHYETYKKIPGKAIQLFTHDLGQINIKGDWLNEPHTLDSIYSLCLIKVYDFNDGSNIATMKVMREDNCIYITHTNRVTNVSTKLCGFELIK